jgi:Histidine kinase-, DNA gyrase B-, and HSP90-like ATPase/GAF domain
MVDDRRKTASTQVLEAAVSARHLGSLVTVLAVVAASIDADGCVLWTRAEPGQDDRDPFSPLAQWWKDDRYHSHDGMSPESLAGRATLTHKRQHIADVRSADPTTFDGIFVARTDTMVICSIPLDLEGTGASALNFYRQRPVPFSEPDLELAEQLSQYVPGALTLLLQRVSLPLLTKTEGILSRWIYDSLSPGPALFPNRHLADCCREVAAVFDCVEVSVFLRDTTFTRDAHVLAASTWPWDIQALQHAYRADEPRLTSSIIRNGRAIRVRDLGDFERNPERMTELYPGTRWSDSFALRERVRDIFQLKGDEQPPLSFMAAPILGGAGDTLGVIRCSTAQSAPFYFLEQQLDILKLVASQIAGCWHSWLTERDLAFESDAWSRLATGLETLNKAPLKMIGTKANIDQLLDSCLEAAARAIPGAEILDVRLFDKEKSVLQFAARFGDSWDDPSQHALERPREKRFMVPGPSIGAEVFSTRQAVFLEDVQTATNYSETFVNCQSLICVPILAMDNCYGVLDVRSRKPHYLHSRSVRSATVLANHIALYVRLKHTVDELVGTRANIQDLRRQQAETYRDLAHQLRTPVGVALDRAARAAAFGLSRRLDLSDQDRFALDKHTGSLRQLRGLLARVKRVTENTDLYSAFAAGRTPPCRKEPIGRDEFIQRITWLARDAELECGARLRITVEQSSFSRIGTLLVDNRLFEQAVANLLDNASKYGFGGTRVRVRWRTEAELSFLSVSSVGLAISEQDVARCAERYWRSDEAKRVVGEGTGIGLWMVERIMEAHGGSLAIVVGGASGDDRNHTEVRLHLRHT